MFLMSDGKMYVRCDFSEWIKEFFMFIGMCIIVGLGVGITTCLAIGIICGFLKIIGA